MWQTARVLSYTCRAGLWKCVTITSRFSRRSRSVRTRSTPRAQSSRETSSRSNSTPGAAAKTSSRLLRPSLSAQWCACSSRHAANISRKGAKAQRRKGGSKFSVASESLTRLCAFAIFAPLREILLTYYGCLHLSHGSFHPNKHCSGDYVVTDIEFGDLLDLCDRAYVPVSQSVARRDIQSILHRQLRRLSQPA